MLDESDIRLFLFLARGGYISVCAFERFGEIATWLAINRAGLTIFAHALHR